MAQMAKASLSQCPKSKALTIKETKMTLKERKNQATSQLTLMISRLKTSRRLKKVRRMRATKARPVRKTPKMMTPAHLPDLLEGKFNRSALLSSVI